MDRLSLSYSTGDGKENPNGSCYINNSAGVYSNSGLRDYSDKKVVFEIDSEVAVGSSWIGISLDENGNIKATTMVNDGNGPYQKEVEPLTIKELIDWFNNNKLIGSYGECSAIVKDNKVIGIQTFQK